MSSRRTNAALPAESLLLRKGLGQVPHEGGRLMWEGSREHRLLLEWIEAGLPGPRQGEPVVTALALEPAHRTLRPGEELRLSARATRSDGSTVDVTWLTRFASNDASTVDVDASGRARALRVGETAVRASFQSLVAVAILTIPRAEPVREDAFPRVASFVDEHVFARLRALGIPPSPVADDATFLRRAFVDTIGTLPRADEARRFLADRSPEKRERLVDALLERPEFVDHWTLELADLLQNRKERDHDVRGTKGVRSFHSWLRRQVAANRPWDQLAREVLTAKGSTPGSPAVGYYVVTVGEERHGERSDVVASAAQSFLGARIVCAKCHNHPLERYTQDDYYRFAAFFSRVKLERKDPREGTTSLLVSHPDRDQEKQPVGVRQPRTGAFLEPRPLDRSPLVVAPGDDPRERLADWMVDPHNELFAGAMVNRLWRHFLGVGLVEPVDDLRDSNPPSNPELWCALLSDFVAGGFDRKRLMRRILTSTTYQLAAATVPGNEDDARYHSHFYLKRLPAEVLLDACAQATGVPDVFPGYPVGLRAIQLPDPGASSYFLSLFGRSERVTACACERSGEVTLPQLLHLQNGDSVVKRIAAEEGRLEKLLRAGLDDGAIVEELFLTTLSRVPAAAERAAVAASLGDAESREEVFRDLFWALLNAKEFAFNH
jgi:hypothetical protein